MRAFYDDAVRAVELARNAGVTILINDRVDIALMTGAGGVHLGQDDLPPAEARRILGSDAVVGFSTHSVEQALLATDLPVDYIVIGPIFETATKANPDPVVGLEGLMAVRKAVDVPLVAIGGINGETLISVLAAGADSIAMIGALYDRNDIAHRYNELSSIAEAYNNIEHS
jgi:thiamine-phosphate pyrophosphorylase